MNLNLFYVHGHCMCPCVREETEKDKERHTEKEFQTSHQAIGNDAFLDFFNYFNVLQSPTHSLSFLGPQSTSRNLKIILDLIVTEYRCRDQVINPQ